MITAVLFVCTGNTCRSPMAEGLLKNILNDNKQNGVTVRSAGVMASDGIPATTGAILIMAEMGVDISSHTSTKLRMNMLKESDIILVMERYHKDIILNMSPELTDKVKLLKEFSNASPIDLDIHDPIGRELEVYRACAKEIQICISQFYNQQMKK